VPATSLSVDPQRLSQLVNLGYEAPGQNNVQGQRAAWRQFAGEAADAFGCQLAMMEWYDNGRPGDSTVATGGLDGFEEVFSGFRSRGPSDAYWATMRDQPAGTVRLGSEIQAPDVMHGSELYSRLAMPWHLEHFLMGTIRSTERSGAFFTLARTAQEQPFQEGDKALISSMLLTHLNRSMTLHQEMAAMRHANAMLAAVMQQAPTGLVVFDAQGKALAANEKASSLFARDDGILLVRGELRAECGAAQAQLNQALAAMLAAANGKLLPAPPTVLVARKTAPQPYRVSFAALGPPECGGEMPRRSAVVAIIHDERRAGGQTVPAVFRATYGLTRAEVRLCETLLAGQSLAEAATALNVSRNTAKTHLARIFDKTGIRSQMALLRLLTLGART